MLNYLLISLLMIISFLQSGCVGTIEDAAKVETNSNIAPKTPLAFKGIEKAVATAHNRVRVSFLPATGGSNQFSYLVYANGNFALPVASISNSSATVDSLGRYNLDVKSLQLNTLYSFSVRVYDVGNDNMDNNVAAVSIRTLTDMVPIFDGAVALENLPGVDGLTNLLITWNTATAAYEDTSGFGTNIHKISGYNIYAGESEETMVLVGSLSDPAAKSFIISSLISGRTYYAMVRARNSATVPVEDKNLTVIGKKTLVAKPIQFTGAKTVSIPKTIEGFSNINVTWDAGTGTFDRYKIMVFTSNPGSIIPASASPSQLTVISDLSVTTAAITVPQPNSTYYVAVIACAGDACAEYDGASVVKSVKTTPPVAPFNGISSITALDLHSVQINWARPDTTQGVYSQIKLFKSDANGSYSELTDEVKVDPGATGLLIDSTTETSIVIKDLTAGVEYCFVAMAYDNFYYTTEYPLGRANTLRVRACITLKYDAPGFLGVNATCTSPNPTGFTISWNTPSPFGIFDYYEFYIKEGNSGFNFADAIAGDPAYTILSPVAKTSNSYSFSNASPIKLASDTFYQIGIKTYYNDNGIIRRDTNNAFTMNCKTNPVSVEMKGWHEIMSLGPKVNGLKSAAIGGVVTENEIIPERIKPYVDVDGVVDVRYLAYAQEWPSGSLGVDSSNKGIIRLMWYDFELSNGLGRLFDYSVSHPLSTVEYKVFRKAHASKYNTAYQLKVKADDTDWGVAINTATIVPQRRILPDGSSFYFGEFTDYTLSHPYLNNKKDEGTIYYYKVEAYIGGKKLSYQGTYADAAVRVVLPPVNMSFAHRWMLNKQMCGDIGKTIDSGDVDRENDYKCLYNGLASTYDSVSGSHYADMKGDLLIDRFKMGCNFSRGGTPNACSDDTNGYYNATSKIFFEGASTDSSKGRLAGDCIGYGGSTGRNPTGIIYAKPNSVFYDRANKACYINTSTASSLNGSGKGTTWALLRTIESSETVTKISSKILPETQSFLGSPGYGSYIYSNNAYLPQLQGGTQNNLYRTCQSHTIDINGILHRKRLMRRKEEVTTFGISSFVSVDVAKRISAGTLFNRDCLSTLPPILTTPNTNADLNLNLYNYPTVVRGGDGASQIIVNGSGGENSTEACFSTFGLQDVAGNYNEVLSDRFYCSSTSMCSSGLKSTTAIGIPASSLTAGQIYTPEIDPKNRDNLMSANGHHLNFSSHAEGNALNLISPVYNVQLTRNPPAEYKYFNPILGVPLSCSGSSCLVGGINDDNTIVSSLASTPGNVSTILNFPIIGNLTTSSSTSTLPGTILPFIINGFTNEQTSTGRHSMVVRSYFDGSQFGVTSGRCTTLVEDYNDQSTQYND